MKQKPKSRNRLIAMLLILLLSLSSILLFSDKLFPNNNNTNNNNSTNGNNNNSTSQIKILNKEIPPEYEMGNILDIGLSTGMSFIRLDKLNQKASIRFTSSHTGKIKSLVVNAVSLTNKTNVKIGLQKDTNGLPDGAWINGNGYGIGEVGTSKGFVEAILLSQINVNKNDVYHIVIEDSDPSLIETISIFTFQENELFKPLNNEDPDIITEDLNINTLHYDGSKWIKKDEWPVFILKYSDGSSEGQPYSLSAGWVIHDKTYVGQTIIPASDYKVGKIAFVITSKGTPTDNLYYQIRDSKNNTLTEGIFTEASQVNTFKKWIEKSLPTAITMEAGKTYRITFSAPGTNLDNAYKIYGHEFCYDPSIGYGGYQHQLTISYDAGKIWAESKDADLIFKITTV